MTDGMEKTAIQWHPGFCGAAEIEFLSNKRDLELISNRGELEFQREYNLGKESLRMELGSIHQGCEWRVLWQG